MEPFDVQFLDEAEYFSFVYGGEWKLTALTDNFASVPMEVRRIGSFSDGQHMLIENKIGGFAGSLPPDFLLGCFAPEKIYLQETGVA